MRTYLIFIVFFLSSCGIIATVKRNNFIESKGYNPRKDTIIIKPYNYYIKYKGYVPLYRELNAINRLDTKISVQGFEDSDTIPFERILDQMKFVLNDSSEMISYGELNLYRNGATNTIRFGKQFPDSCTCKASFGTLQRRVKRKRKGDVLFFWNVQVLKDNNTYTLPSRVYYLR